VRVTREEGSREHSARDTGVIQDVVHQPIPILAAHPLSQQLGTILGVCVRSGRCAATVTGRGRVRRVLPRAAALGAEPSADTAAGRLGRLDQQDDQ